MRLVPRNQNIAKESNDLISQGLADPNQKSNGLSMNRKCGQRFTTDDRRTFTNKILSADKADKDKVYRNCKFSETIYNKDAIHV